MRPLRAPAIGLGISWLVAIVCLGPLLGSSADASTAYALHFDNNFNLTRDLVGALALVVAAGMLIWTTTRARVVTEPSSGSSTRDLVAAAGTVTASVVIVAAGLLAAVPLTTALANLNGDPGIDVPVQAGVAQAGMVVLLVAALALAATTVLLARLGAQSGAVPRWIFVTAWITAGLLVLGITVALLVPFAAWAVALGLAWTMYDRTPDATTPRVE